jgi:galactokinase
MKADALAQRLAAAGMDDGEADRKRALIEAVLAAFDDWCGGAPSDAWWVPGRLEVFGKHTDYAGGHSLVGTVPRGFVLVARRRKDRLVRIRDARRGQDLELHPPYTGQVFTGWRHYASVAARRLLRNFPGARLGADLVLASDLPPASGMSSSSALVVGMVKALVRLADLEPRPEWRENIRSQADEAGYYACFENGLSFGTLGGDGGVGTHGGSEDHIALVCGRARELSAWRFVPIAPVDTVAVPRAWSFVIASSGVAAEKTGGAQEAYNSLSQRAQMLLDFWTGAGNHAASLRDAMTSDADAPGRLRAILGNGSLDPVVRALLESRLAQFLREDARVVEAVRAIREADAGRLGELAAASQRDAESLLGNQVPETIELAESAREMGAFAASSFGAGFGGSAWALVHADDAPAFAPRWLKAYRQRFPKREAATVFLAQPGPGLMRLGSGL